MAEAERPDLKQLFAFSGLGRVPGTRRLADRFFARAEAAPACNTTP